MTSPIVILLFTQMLFSAGDVMARHFMSKRGFSVAAFVSWWFLAYFLIRLLATFGQMYVFANFELGRTMTLFGVSGLVIANILGFLLLSETFSVTTYFGIILALISFIIVGTSKV